ncbi:hypothetical protein Y036_6208 [Burkholderia pseudomallei]|uniref:Uncharacterized protein n=1 Tax=Burkholderia pseudomallei TaxID=28450 RepID=A0AA40JJ65_BURPE|nr:hypothetical protein Y036_6208 [Burkholderia pseudomallei]
MMSSTSALLRFAVHRLMSSSIFVLIVFPFIITCVGFHLVNTRLRNSQSALNTEILTPPLTQNPPGAPSKLRMHPDTRHGLTR